MNKKKTSNYKQTLHNPMHKTTCYAYVDDDVMEYLRKLKHGIDELSEDVAIIKSEITEIKNMLKERQGALGVVSSDNRYSNNRHNGGDNNVISKPSTSKLPFHGK